MLKFRKILFTFTICALIFMIPTPVHASESSAFKIDGFDSILVKDTPVYVQTNPTSIEAQLDMLANQTVCPAYGPITSGYGNRIHPLSGSLRHHDGIDFGISTGTPVYAHKDGTVVDSSYQGGYGSIIEIDTGEYTYFYAHLSKRTANIGEHVQTGDVVALSGNTGSSTTGPHLHIEQHINGVAVDPIDLLESC